MRKKMKNHKLKVVFEHSVLTVFTSVVFLRVKTPSKTSRKASRHMSMYYLSWLKPILWHKTNFHLRFCHLVLMTTQRSKLSKYLKTLSDILIIELIISLLCAREGEFFTNQSVVNKKSYLILQEYKNVHTNWHFQIIDCGKCYNAA